MAAQTLRVAPAARAGEPREHRAAMGRARRPATRSGSSGSLSQVLDAAVASANRFLWALPSSFSSWRGPHAARDRLSARRTGSTGTIVGAP